MLLHPLHLVLIALQPGTHVVGHVLIGKGAAVGIAEDVGSAVVTTDDDEALLLADVEHVVIGIVLLRLLDAQLLLGQPHVVGCTTSGHELLCTLLCLLQRHGCSHRYDTHDKPH